MTLFRARRRVHHAAAATTRDARGWLAGWLSALALCGSCAKPPSEPAKPIPGQRLVGTWQQDMALDTELIKVLSEIGVKAGKPPIEDPEKFAREFEAEYAKDPEGGKPMRLIFELDGDYTLQGWILGHDVYESKWRWRVLEEDSKRITVSVSNPKHPDGDAMTYEFVEADVIRADERAGGSYFRRVNE